MNDIQSGENNLAKFRNLDVTNRIIVLALIALFVSIFFLQNIKFIQSDTGLKATDWQTLHSVYFYRVDQFKDYSFQNSYPPLVYMTTIPFYNSMGLLKDTARFSLCIYWLIFLLSMFAIGHRLGDVYSGFAVMALAAASPYVLLYSRRYYLDFPQTALTALCFYLLLKTEEFTDRKASIFFGIALGLAMLAKWSAIFFLFVPLCWYLLKIIIKAPGSIVTLVVFALFPGGFVYLACNYCLNSLNNNYHPTVWLGLYMIGIPLAAALGFLLLLRARWMKKTDGFRESRLDSSFNYVFAMMAACSLFFCWIVYALPGVWNRFPSEKSSITEFGSRTLTLFKYFYALETMVSFLPVLLLISLYYIVSRKKIAFFGMTLLNIAFTLLLLIMLVTHDIDPYRYTLSLVIFIAGLCGWWVAYAGKAKPFAAFLIVLVCLVGMCAWTFVPGDLPHFYVLDRENVDDFGFTPLSIIITKEPDRAYVSFEALVKRFEKDCFPANVPDNLRKTSYHMIITCPTTPREDMGLKENILIEMIRQGQKPCVQSFQNIGALDGNMDYKPIEDNGWVIPNIIIVSDNPEQLSSYGDEIVSKYDGAYNKHNILSVGSRFFVTVLTTEKDYIKTHGYDGTGDGVN